MVQETLVSPVEDYNASANMLHDSPGLNFPAKEQETSQQPL